MTATLHLHPYAQQQFAHIVLDNPPVNGLSHATRMAIATHLDEIERQPSTVAVLISGSDTAFSGGADIKEFGSDRAYADPILPDLLFRIERFAKPVIAVIHGLALGGGLELALACHYRLAHRQAKLALPEVKLGLLPGAGGTQRLPRLLPMDICIEMICEASTRRAEDIHAVAGQRLIHGLLDANWGESALEASLAFAASVCRQLPPSKSSDYEIVSPPNEYLFEQAKTRLLKKSKQLQAPQLALEALMTSTKTAFEEGLKKERALFSTLMEGEQSKALRHAFAAERSASKIEGLADGTQARSVRRVAVIGAGTMGTGIAMCFANAGIPVALLDLQPSSLEKGLERIRQTYQSSVEKKKLSQIEADQRADLIKVVHHYADLAECELAIEAVFEDMQVKQTVFRELEKVLAPSAILASNTSSLDLNALAKLVSRPGNVIGLHFFSPANIMPLLEIVRTDTSSDEVLLTCAQLAKKIQKVAVIAGVCDGFIGNRMLEQYTKQAAFLLEEGCTPQQVDQAIEAFGFAMGPFRMNDLAGNDISWAIRQRRRAANPNAIYSRLGDLLCEKGRYGQKTQAGWYDYRADDRTAYPSTMVEQMIKQYAHDKAIVQRKIGDEEIVLRLVLALANEGRKILRDKIAHRASDIDIVYLKGYGFPAYRGGPMFFAQQLGWDRVDELIRGYALGHQGETWGLP